MCHHADSEARQALLGERPLPEWQALYVSHYVFCGTPLKSWAPPYHS